jgi:alpha-D-xyloside xylohydrolase
MLLEFPDDPGCDYLDRQYMLGPSLLVAPVFNKEGLAEYYLPAGRWTNFLTDEVVVCGGWRREQVDFMSIPLWVRENTIIPVGANTERPDYNYADGVSLHIFNVRDGADLKVEIPNVQGQVAATFHCTRRGKTLRVTSEDAVGAWSIQLRGAGHHAAVQAQSNQIEIELAA